MFDTCLIYRPAGKLPNQIRKIVKPRLRDFAIYGTSGSFLSELKVVFLIFKRQFTPFLIACRMPVLFFKGTLFNDLIYSQSISKEVPFCVKE